ncbi:GntR family transcriptional regulator [Caulobacter vibrioides]|uniref:Transcriptional regulator, GntR family n=2 Tax=Caulobacter vibrioides TaxID=155892 RepID=Q9A5Q5_CAUVC|nr:MULTISPECIES: GntR family transcriptional regulator [Bacteria]YP_002517848.1 transcriptional regulator vanR [Caulobacter vibrioides NA1000]AKZ19134.1 transcriptional regulator vanR [Expression vector pRK2-Geo2i]QQZ45552.1 VanR [synthetic construct]QVV57709.1 VanR [Vector pDPO-mxn116-Pvan-Tpase]UEN69782.1 two-component response regulator [Cloning vector pArg2345-V1-BsaI-Pvan]AAK24363.1 transcriptional regulator, GntR family [Caulobacter vibrioides CB15]
MDMPRIKPGQRVMMALRKMIASGEIKSGERIAEIPTAAALGVSRMPVRTALRSLEQEGLVVRLGARGYAARGVSSDQIRDAIEVRGVLEGFAARRLAERGMTAETHARFVALIAEGEALFAAGRLNGEDLDRYAAYNQAFHDTLVSAAGNGAVESALARNGFEPFAAAGALALDLMDLPAEYEHLLAAHRQHQAVLDAVSCGDAEGAERIMRDHALAAIRNAKVFEAAASAGAPLGAAWSIRAD